MTTNLVMGVVIFAMFWCSVEILLVHIASIYKFSTEKENATCKLKKTHLPIE